VPACSIGALIDVGAPGSLLLIIKDGLIACWTSNLLARITALSVDTHCQLAVARILTVFVCLSLIIIKPLNTFVDVKTSSSTFAASTEPRFALAHIVADGILTNGVLVTFVNPASTLVDVFAFRLPSTLKTVRALCALVSTDQICALRQRIANSSLLRTLVNVNAPVFAISTIVVLWTLSASKAALKIETKRVLIATTILRCTLVNILAS
jgi:hypothetical protein